MAAGEKTPLTRDVELGINASKAVVRTRLRIDNACCEAEATLAKKTLHAIAGVDRVSVNVVGRIAYATHRPHLVGAQALADALNEHNLGASVAAAPEAADNVEEPVDYKELAFVAALLLGLALGYVIPSLLVVVAVGGAAPLARDAVRGALLQKRLDVNALMLCAVLGALALKDTGEAATVGAVAAFARFAEAECLRRVRNALADASASEGAQVKATKGDGTVVDADSLIVGDVVIVRAGERVPCDGVVVSGKAAIDESALTGEPLPVHKAKGESVSGGTVATNGFVKIKVSATRAEDAAAELRRLVDEAQASSTRTQEVLQEFAAYFTPGVLVTAMLVALVVSLQRALVLLVVACPCALVLAAPVPAVASIGAGARRGILVKAASALEALAQVSIVCADKTGTLTQGRCRVVAAGGPSGKDALRLAASLEAKSTHPLAAAVVNEAVGCVGEDVAGGGSLAEDVRDVNVVAGAGMAGTVEGHAVKVGTAAFCGVTTETWAPKHPGATLVWVAVDNIPSLCLAVVDPLRAETPRALQTMFGMGLRVAVLTGDTPAAAHAALEATKIDTARVDVRASCAPPDKLAYVNACMDGGAGVLFVGDGVNDAPALAAASVGVAMGAGGTAMAVDAADLALMTDDVALLPAAIDLGRTCTRLVKQNIGIAVGVKALVVVCALAFDLALWVAVLADLGSLLLVVANGSRPLLEAAPAPPPAETLYQATMSPVVAEATREPATLYQATQQTPPRAPSPPPGEFVVYYAAWSQPSMLAKAALEAAAAARGGSVKAVDVDDDSDDEAGAHGVAEVPTVARVRGGAVQAKLVGAACSASAIGALVRG